ncbi:probable citrate lyase beta chain (citrase) (citryl-coa lyase subunit) protein [Fulvimarina pelagi HTCC2506]|uniref:Probable citrate lyase beta chain (Citrase) (Citryl-coa lyase subunit) protein n=1 Tax=Fulvimarina pelagi HTCC2506 TaxID=314231 RepID=Q0G523_9HYPH|nr:CoA ester lyase [Fulvimarina pelagi]EAU43241.1 probable citrate lyase beta chain (citrase) (citryl-coa lyase subunit) protein [Fulvimarina pelagi HTCC2506]
MPTTVPPRRSLLLVPASNARALEASDRVEADGIVYDLSETVAPADKPDAREKLRAHLATSTFAGERIVRINGLDTIWGTEDFLAARGAGVDAILLPRVEEPSVVRQIVTALHETDAPEGLKLWAMVETPTGVANATAIAGESSGRLAALVVGIGTLKIASGMRPDRDRTELTPWLATIVLAAKSRGLSAIDSIFPDVHDAEGFSRECGSGQRLGFDGKLTIHPQQVGEANERFSPPRAAIEWAKKMVDAFSTSPDIEAGVATLDGRTIDRLHLAEADRILKLRDAIEARRHSKDPSP